MRAYGVSVPMAVSAMMLALGMASCSGTNPVPGSLARVGTAESRGALFDSILAMTERREAFSPLKEATLGFSALDDMRALREEFVNVSTEAELYYALVRLSNARRDHHLSVSPVLGGLRLAELPNVSAPIRVLVDYTNLNVPTFFLAAVDESALGTEDARPTPGHRIVRINERTIAEYVEAFTPWVVHSSIHGLYWDMARDLPRRMANVPPWMYESSLRLDLEPRSGDGYSLSLPYMATRDLRLRSRKTRCTRVSPWSSSA